MTDAEGAPLTDITVVAVPPSADREPVWTTTYEDGSYGLPLVAGVPYELLALDLREDPESRQRAGSAGEMTVASEEAAEHDFTLQAGVEGVRGSVLDDTGGDQTEGLLRVWKTGAGRVISLPFDGGSFNVPSLPAGSYEFEFLPASRAALVAEFTSRELVEETLDVSTEWLGGTDILALPGWNPVLEEDENPRPGRIGLATDLSEVIQVFSSEFGKWMMGPFATKPEEPRRIITGMSRLPECCECPGLKEAFDEARNADTKRLLAYKIWGEEYENRATIMGGSAAALGFKTIEVAGRWYLEYRLKGAEDAIDNAFENLAVARGMSNQAATWQQADAVTQTSLQAMNEASDLLRSTDGIMQLLGQAGNLGDASAGSWVNAGLGGAGFKNMKDVGMDILKIMNTGQGGFSHMSRDAQIEFLLDMSSHAAAAAGELDTQITRIKAIKNFLRGGGGQAKPAKTPKIVQVLSKAADVLTLLKLALQAGSDFFDGVHVLNKAENEAKSWHSRVLAARARMYAIHNRCVALCAQKPQEDCPPEPPEEPPGGTPGGSSHLTAFGSTDPNEKWTTGVGSEGWIRRGTPIVYTVLFENKSTATAAAQEVLVSDGLDPKLDWSSLQWLSLSFNQVDLTIPEGLAAWRARASVDTDPNPVEVELGLDPATGELTAYLHSVDALTGDWPVDPLAGFLPPNDDQHRGEGWFTYSVVPQPGLPDGTVITNRAVITFDVNEPIATELVVNTLDGSAPTSRATADETPASSLFTVAWSGDDGAGSGVAAYDVYVSVDGGAFSPWLTGATATSATWFGEAGHQYGFFSLARDQVGNLEPMKSEADVWVTPASTGLTYAQWLARHFEAADLEDPSLESTVWGRAADPEGDGVINFVEYLAGRDPWRAEGGALLGARIEGGRFILTYRRSKAALEGAYVVDWSTDLVEWHPEGIVPLPVQETGEAWQMEAATTLDTDEALFLRLRAAP